MTIKHKMGGGGISISLSNLSIPGLRLLDFVWVQCQSRGHCGSGAFGGSAPGCV